jgi:hypothetical protein
MIRAPVAGYGSASRPTSWWDSGALDEIVPDARQSARGVTGRLADLPARQPLLRDRSALRDRVVAVRQGSRAGPWCRAIRDFAHERIHVRLRAREPDKTAFDAYGAARRCRDSHLALRCAAA